MIHYLVNERKLSLSSIISLYEKGVSKGRQKAIEELVGGSYEELATDFENWVTNN